MHQIDIRFVLKKFGICTLFIVRFKKDIVLIIKCGKSELFQHNVVLVPKLFYISQGGTKMLYVTTMSGFQKVYQF